MPPKDDSRERAYIDELLTAVGRTIAGVRWCWLVTRADTGGPNARPMGRIPSDVDESTWTIRFVTNRRSRKATEIRHNSNVAVVFQRVSDNSFITLIGKAELLESALDIRRRWKRAYEVYFPSDADRANAAFIEVEVARMELWIRGVTPEPFGLKPTVVEYDGAGTWRLLSGDCAPVESSQSRV